MHQYDVNTCLKDDTDCREREGWCVVPLQWVSCKKRQDRGQKAIPWRLSGSAATMDRKDKVYTEVHLPEGRAFNYSDTRTDLQI